MTVSRTVTPEKIDAAVKRLVEVAQPSRIILFGSAARGDLHEHSDVDLLVVLPEEPESVREVERRIDNAVAGIRMPKDILVVSEERLAELGDRPSLVYREALREGRVVYEAPRMSQRRKGTKRLKPSAAGLPHTWLAYARRDLAAARTLHANPEDFLEQVGFHAQQAAEKAVKAVVLEMKIEFDFTHNLGDLLKDLRDNGVVPPPEVARASTLTRFAVDTRYPDSPEEITEADLADALHLAEATVAWVAGLVTVPGAER
jgi:HEPN domain-containing protein/predicted nucleotidyltransferase